MSFNERLVSLRKGIGLNQQELADTINVSIDSVRRWEAGKQEPRLSDLKTLAVTLGVTIGELSEEEPLREGRCPVQRPQSGQKPLNGKFSKIVIQHGQLKLEIPADDKGYAFLNSKLKEFTVNDSLSATVVNEE